MRARAGWAAARPAAAPAPAAARLRKWGEVERKPMSNIRRKTAEHLGHAWNVDPARHAARQGGHHRARGAAQAVRAAGGERRRQADDDGDRAEDRRRRAARSSRSSTRRSTWRASEIVYKKFVHIGVAVDTERGLLVPVIRDVDRKGILELSAELAKAVGEGARRQAVARRDAGRRLHDHEPRRHRRPRSRRSSTGRRSRSSASRAARRSRSGTAGSSSRG